jgi:hypothetical protein
MKRSLDRATVRVAIAACGALLLASGTARADGDTGCGLGSQIWEGQSSVPAKVLAATTNGTLGNQTFGISSGTLGCEPGSVIKAEQRLNVFASANLDRLAREIAIGEGEVLDALAHLYGVEPGDQAAFVERLHGRFEAIFPTASVTAGDVLAGIDRALADDPQLARYARG